jgi:hypothetical protein
MDSHLISECILRSIEERRRRRHGPPPAGGEAPPPKIGQPIVSACASELDSALRDAILTSFHEWEAQLIPHMEGIARSRPSPQPQPEEVLAATPSPGPAPATLPLLELVTGEPGPADPERPAASSRAAPIEDSWGSLAEAVRDLRKEWDAETFEARFGRDGETRGARAAGAPAQTVPPPSPSAAPPAAPPAAPARPDPGAAAGPAGSAAALPAREPLAEKLDELIRLVRSSLDERGSQGTSGISSAISREVAREVAGRLRETLKGLGATPAAPPAAGPAPAAPPPPARIPLDDLNSIIDQITGSSPP